MNDWKNTLVPWDPNEAADFKHAARIAGRSTSTVRSWCEVHGIGRRVVGKHSVSVAALLMLLEDNHKALAAYHAGDRSSDMVAPYFIRAREIIFARNAQNAPIRAERTESL